MAEDKSFYRVDFRSVGPLTEDSLDIIRRATESVYSGNPSGILRDGARSFNFQGMPLETGNPSKNILIVERV